MPDQGMPASPANPAGADGNGNGNGNGEGEGEAHNRQARERFVALMREWAASDRLVRVLLTGYRGNEDGLQRILARPVLVRDAQQLQFVHRYKTRDLTSNLPLEQGLAQLESLIGSAFENAHLHSADEDVQLARSRKGRLSVRRGAAVPAANAGSREHDRDKARFIDQARPFLVELGVTDAQHQLIPAMARKWKQLNKFIEIFDHAMGSSGLAAHGADGGPVRVADFGCGKGYLTFAVHDYLQNRLAGEAVERAADTPAIHVTGIELRRELVDFCNRAAGKLGLKGLDFVQGDIASHAATAPVDIMIALHACDTATDHAMHAGIRAGAAIIMCSPCCHKQIRPQMQMPTLLRPMLQHGIHMGQEAEMVTDSLRAMLLEASGYQTQVFEFVSLEHTSKNKMILAVKRAAGIDVAAREKLLEQIRDIKAFYGIREQCLESLLSN